MHVFYFAYVRDLEMWLIFNHCERLFIGGLASLAALNAYLSYRGLKAIVRGEA